jgi:hypothetical protein
MQKLRDEVAEAYYQYVFKRLAYIEALEQLPPAERASWEADDAYNALLEWRRALSNFVQPTK